jgi:alpha 1,2-mannosyltransferase
LNLASTGDITTLVRVSGRHYRLSFPRTDVFLNDEPFDEAFIKSTSACVSGTAEYGLVPKDEWEEPDWIDENKAAGVRKAMEADGVM